MQPWLDTTLYPDVDPPEEMVTLYLAEILLNFTVIISSPQSSVQSPESG